MGLVRQLTPMYDSAYCTSLAGTPDGVISRLFCLARISIQETPRATIRVVWQRSFYSLCIPRVKFAS